MQPIKISIVTVCYNMAPYIEQTLCSVLSQNYPNLEYIVIDGGSTDGTQEIISRYRDRLAYYVSEPDNGMYDAIHKGFQKATGEVLAWLNADDCYFPWTLQLVSDIFTKWEDVDWIGGKYAFLTQSGVLGHLFPKCAARTQQDIRNGWCREGVLGPLQQESMFWRRSLYVSAGGLNTSYRYAGDFELWMRFAAHASLVKVDLPLAAFRKRPDSLSAAGQKAYNDEVMRATEGLASYPNLLWRWLKNSRVGIQLLRMMRLRHIDVIYHTLSTQELQRKRILTSVGSQTPHSLFLYR